VTRHRFINDGRSPIPMGAVAEYTCICGKRGTYSAIEQHIAEKSDEDVSAAGVVTARYAPIDDGDEFGGGDTMAHYLPHAPRKPAPTGESLPLQRPTPEPLPPPPPTPREDTCPLCGIGDPACNLPEIAAWSCGHWIHKRPRSIAELFQDMLRIAYQAGARSGTDGEPFERWYEREVLT
jgi:hypothetical protein